jgi:hypothetical protein
MRYAGRCHCGMVRIAVEAPADLECEDCNCSICAPSGFLHLIVPASRFELLAGEDALTTYTFGTGTAKHRFCRYCGIKVFYVPRSNPDGYDVNVRCLSPRPRSLIIRPFDGANWERHAHELAHLSRE